MSMGSAKRWSSFRIADKSSRHAGKRLITQPLIQGRNPEVWFDKDVRSLADGDVYMDPMEVEKKLQQYAGGKPVTERAFFPPKNSKKRCGKNEHACTLRLITWVVRIITRISMGMPLQRVSW